MTYLPASRPSIKASLVITDSSPKPNAERHEYTSVEEAFTAFERLRHQMRYENRDRHTASPNAVHYFDMTLFDLTDPSEAKVVTRTMRVVTPDGHWTDNSAHVWLTEGTPRWLRTTGDYNDPNQPVVNYNFS